MPSYTDQINRTVEIIKLPKRVVSLVPSQTELLFDLGLKEEVVGVTKFCIHPGDKTHNKEKIGGTKKLDIQKIIDLKPDLVLANKEENVQEQIEALAKEVPVWVSDIASLDDSLGMIEAMGKILAKKRVTEILLKRIDGEFQKLNYLVENMPRRKVAYLIWRDPMMVVGGDSFISDMLDKAGFENVFQDAERYPKVSPEELREKDADLIFLSSEPFPFDHTHFEEFREMCPDSKVFLVEGEKFSWYGSHLVKSPGYFMAFQRSLKLLAGGSSLAT